MKLNKYIYIDQHPGKAVIIGGDFNINLSVDYSSQPARLCLDVFAKYNLISAYDCLPGNNFVTYRNEKLGRESLLDYVFTNHIVHVDDVCIYEPDLGFSA